MIQACEELSVCMKGIKSSLEFEESIVVRRAVTMCILDLGELITGLRERELSSYPSESWNRIIGFRNRAAHGYKSMDFSIVYTLATVRIPEIYEYLKKQQAKQNNEPSNPQQHTV
jgi:uncharacterized protein with HEPN domain